jgi:hypothetical protein
MDSKAYFNAVSKLEAEYKDSIEIFKFDVIPGKDQINKNIKVRSYSKALGAYLFVRYSAQGKFMENIGSAAVLIVKCMPDRIEIVPKNKFKQVFPGK